MRSRDRAASYIIETPVVGLAHHRVQGADALHAVAKPVDNFGTDLQTLIDDMIETMDAMPGVGLAAPQIGVLSRVIVLDCVKEEGEAPRPLLMFPESGIAGWQAAKRPPAVIARSVRVII